jgi:hypothetical protein
MSKKTLEDTVVDCVLKEDPDMMEQDEAKIYTMLDRYGIYKFMLAVQAAADELSHGAEEDGDKDLASDWTNIEDLIMRFTGNQLKKYKADY